MSTKSNTNGAKKRPKCSRAKGGRRPSFCSPCESPLDWAIGQLEKMAAEENDPFLKALWLRATAAGYDRKAKANVADEATAK